MELGKLTVQVQKDGGTVDVVVDLDPNHLTLQESVRVERELGAEARAMFKGEEVDVSPRVIQVLIWAKLVSRFPDLKVDGFDLELGSLADMVTEDDDRAVDLEPAEIEAALFATDTPLEAVGEGKA